MCVRMEYVRECAQQQKAPESGRIAFRGCACRAIAVSAKFAYIQMWTE